MTTKILVVDDDADIEMVLTDRLAAMGYRVKAASDGQAALASIAEELPGLVFLDIEMPNLNGFEVLRCIRNEWPELPVVVMTAHGTIARAVEAMKEGATDFITKPFEMEKLRTVIAKALERKALSGEVIRLLGDISHDIKNLLSPVVCGAELLESEIDDFFARLPQMEAAQAEASRTLCNEVIAMLRDTGSRIQQRTKEIADYMKGLRIPIQFAPCHLAQVVEDVFKTLRLVAAEKQIVLRSEGLHQLPQIVADEHRLYTAIYNLVNNAIQAVSPEGVITIRGQADPDPGSLLVSVIDNGRGMPEDVRQSLFTAQAISLTSKGTGLGTKIVKDVVDAHGGEIWVDSKEGQGTAFHIRLPMQQHSAGTVG
jgi:signal transduction histidine kinase